MALQKIGRTYYSVVNGVRCDEWTLHDVVDQAFLKLSEDQ